MPAGVIRGARLFRSPRSSATDREGSGGCGADAPRLHCRGCRPRDARSHGNTSAPTPGRRRRQRGRRIPRNSGPPASSPAVCAGVSPAQWRRDAATDSRRDAGGPLVLPLGEASAACGARCRSAAAVPVRAARWLSQMAASRSPPPFGEVPITSSRRRCRTPSSCRSGSSTASRGNCTCCRCSPSRRCSSTAPG